MTDLFKRACAAQAKALRDFGYPDVTFDYVEKAHRKWKAGEELTGIVEMFCERAFEEHPDLFGKPDAAA